LDELRVLQARMAEMDTLKPPRTAGKAAAPPQSPEEGEGTFSFAPQRAAILDAAATGLLKKIRKIDISDQRTEGFASERPIDATITSRDLVEEPLFWGDDVTGRRVLVLTHRDGDAYGFDEDVFAETQTLIEGVLISGWARQTLSRSFIEKVVVAWLRSVFGEKETRSLSEDIARASTAAVRSLELWAPVAYLEVQTPFALGPVLITTITKAKIDNLEAEALASAPAQRDAIADLFSGL
jgi:hypothetical protein